MDRFTDIPLHSSAAQPYTPPEHQPPVIPERIRKCILFFFTSERTMKALTCFCVSLPFGSDAAGQRLEGDMIPRVIDHGADDFSDEVAAEQKEKKNN